MVQDGSEYWIAIAVFITAIACLYAGRMDFFYFFGGIVILFGAIVVHRRIKHGGW